MQYRDLSVKVAEDVFKIEFSILLHSTLKTEVLNHKIAILKQIKVILIQLTKNPRSETEEQNIILMNLIHPIFINLVFLLSLSYRNILRDIFDQTSSCSLIKEIVVLTSKILFRDIFEKYPG